MSNLQTYFKNGNKQIGSKTIKKNKGLTNTIWDSEGKVISKEPNGS